jgi:D-galactarolactone isomerase
MQTLRIACSALPTSSPDMPNQPNPPTTVAPSGACDCHIHIYEPGYPLAPTATFQPPPAPVSVYQLVQQALGLSRVVVVQPTGYGFDNRCTVAALARLGSQARGVAVVPADVTDEELQHLHAVGIRGVRFMMLPGGLLSWDQLAPLAARIQPLGWHINLQMDGREFPLHEARLQALPVPLVIDHVGKFLGPVTPADAAFAALCRLLDAGRCWIKLSAPYESSRSGPPGYEDVAILVRALAQQFPQRCLWGSNWPHPNRSPVPSDQNTLDMFKAWVPRPAVQQILVDNPQALYGF